jgi:hypothetical protein
MTRNETRAAILIMEAYLDGYQIQRCGKQWNPKESLKPDWCDTDEPCWDFDSCDYRIKPTAKLRPWTADEVPLGAWMRFKRNPQDRVLLGWVSVQADRDLWLDEREYSTDGGVTWKPCGVVEESK